MFVGRDSAGKFRPRTDRRDRKLSVRCHANDLIELDELAHAHQVTRSEIALEIIREAILDAHSHRRGRKPLYYA